MMDDVCGAAVSVHGLAPEAAFLRPSGAWVVNDHELHRPPDGFERAVGKALGAGRSARRGEQGLAGAAEGGELDSRERVGFDMGFGCHGLDG